MANSGIGYFDQRGEYFRTPAEATISDLAGILGKIGEGDSLAPGIAVMLLDKRKEIEEIFTEHDRMTSQEAGSEGNADSEVVILPRR